MLRNVRMKCLELPHSSLAPGCLLKMQIRFCLLFSQSTQWLFFSHPKKKKKKKPARVCKKLQSLCDMPVLMIPPTPSAPPLPPQPHWPLCNSLNHKKKPPPPVSVSFPFCPPGMLPHREMQGCSFSSSGLCSESLYPQRFP